MKRKPHTWDSIYLNAIARGYDNGYAAFLADGWEIRKLKRERKAYEKRMTTPKSSGCVMRARSKE